MARTKRVPRWLKVILWTVVALVTVFYAAGGVVFANMIYTDALVPQGPTPDHGVYVTAVEDTSITLSSEEEREDTKRPGFAGLAWEGGYGLLEEIVAVDGLKVTRGFIVVSGTPPEACEVALTDCEEFDIESWTFQTDPSDVGLSFEEVSFDSPLGKMGAWIVESGDGSIWAIHAHGWRASRREALRMLPTYYESGITSLVIDSRNDEASPDDPSGLYRFGRTEWEDIEAAVQFALDQGARQVVLAGYSTGSALQLAFLENSELADVVVAAVHDAPNIDMAETVRFEASKRTIPSTPFPVPGSLTTVAMAVADLRWDVDWWGIDYVDRTDEIVQVPTLVFHGTEDDRVPIEVSRRFRDQAPDRIQLVEVESGGHVTSWNVDPRSYDQTLSAFLAQIGD